MKVTSHVTQMSWRRAGQPVEYCDDDDEEGEGLDDDEIEELIYEDDPLLAHSHTEDYNEDY